MARLTAGLIVNTTDPADHANNVCVQPMSGKFRGYRPLKWTRRSCPGVAAKVEKIGGGWRRGVALLDGIVVYRGPATRNQAEAWDYACSRLDVIKMGL